MILTRVFHLITRLFTDENLTKKAYLNIINNALTYVVKLGVLFIITPMMVAGLGSYLYGLWQVINRTIGYISPASGRPTEALQWVIAKNQVSTDYNLKRQYIGSAIIVWGIFLPLMISIGVALSWFTPLWFKVPSEYFIIVRITALLLVFSSAGQVLSELPQSILRGENLGYKRMGLTLFLTLVGGVGTWLALVFKTGIIGLSAMTLLITLLNGLLYLGLAKKYIKWFGAARPPLSQIKEFFGLSGWFMGWNLVWTSMFATDVVLLGLMTSVERVTIYTLTKYVPEILISLTQFLIAGVGPGLGGIIGRGEIHRAAQLRSEMLTLNWLAGTAVGATVVIWNRTFISLWVGPDKYAGSWAALLIVVAVFQFILIQNDAGIIDVTLRMSKKVLLGALSVIITVAASYLFVNILQLDIIGITMGLILGRTLLSIGYPLIVGNALQIPIATQIAGLFRPGVIGILILVLGYQLGLMVPAESYSGIGGWLLFFIFAVATFAVLFLCAFFFGLNQEQRSGLFRRIKIILGLRQT